MRHKYRIGLQSTLNILTRWQNLSNHFGTLRDQNLLLKTRQIVAGYRFGVKPTLKVVISQESYLWNKLIMILTMIIVSLILIGIAIICILTIERAYNGFYNFLTYSVYFFDVVACIIGLIGIGYASICCLWGAPVCPPPRVPALAIYFFVNKN